MQKQFILETEFPSLQPPLKFAHRLNCILFPGITARNDSPFAR
jgi:hypothetical protein